MNKLSFFDLSNWTDKELIEYGRAGRNLLMKRRKRLEEAISKNPGRYSTHGLKELQDDGIPMISSKMGRNTLKANVMRIEELKNMKTTTARGAKRHQNEQIRLMLNLPIKGRLRAQEQREFNQVLDYIDSHPDVMSNYWIAFDYYKNQIMYKGYLDSKQELEEFREKFNNLIFNGPNQSIASIFQEIDRIVNEDIIEYERERRQMMNIGRKGGFL